MVWFGFHKAKEETDQGKREKIQGERKDEGERGKKENANMTKCRCWLVAEAVVRHLSVTYTPLGS